MHFPTGDSVAVRIIENGLIYLVLCIQNPYCHTKLTTHRERDCNMRAVDNVQTGVSVSY
jgi:hypothetical protein